MPIFEWTQELDVGCDEMNNEHKQLISYMNKVYDLNQENVEPPVIKLALNEFLECTKNHFSDEEAYMASFNYDDIETHKEKHRKLFEDLTLYIDEFERTGVLDNGFFEFLKLWLRGHIIYIDGKYKRFVEALQQNA